MITCIVCGVEQEENQFRIDHGQKLGRQRRCKTCRKAGRKSDRTLPPPPPLDADRQTLVEQNLKLAFHFGPKFAYGRIPHEDAVELALYALTVAAARFDFTLGHFDTWAVRAIRDTVSNYCRLSRPKHFTDLGEEQRLVINAIRADDPQARVEKAREAAALWGEIRLLADRVLSPLEQRVLCAFFQQGRYQHEAARALGISRQYVGQIAARVQRKLTAAVAKAGLEADLEAVLDG